MKILTGNPKTPQVEEVPSFITGASNLGTAEDGPHLGLRPWAPAPMLELHWTWAEWDALVAKMAEYRRPAPVLTVFPAEDPCPVCLEGGTTEGCPECGVVAEPVERTEEDRG